MKSIYIIKDILTCNKKNAELVLYQLYKYTLFSDLHFSYIERMEYKKDGYIVTTNTSQFFVKIDKSCFFVFFVEKI